MTFEERFKELAKAAEAIAQTELKEKILDLQQDVIARMDDQKHRDDRLARAIDGLDHVLRNGIVRLSTFGELLEGSYQDADYRAGLSLALTSTVQMLRQVVKPLLAQLKTPGDPPSTSDL